MSKNNHEDFLGCHTRGYEDIKLLKIYPLPPDTTVMVVDTDKDDNVVMRDCVETGISSGAKQMAIMPKASRISKRSF